MSETGTFLNQAPFPPVVEHPYSFGQANPAIFLDPEGTMFDAIGGAIGGAGVTIGGAIGGTVGGMKLVGSTATRNACFVKVSARYHGTLMSMKNDKVRHCTWHCMLAAKCGSGGCSAVGYAFELSNYFTSSSGYDPKDTNANKIGCSIGASACKKNTFKNCQDKCQHLFDRGYMPHNNGPGPRVKDLSKYLPPLLAL